MKSRKRRIVRRGRGTKGPSLAQYLAISLAMAIVYILILRNLILDLDNPVSWAIFIAWTIFSSIIGYYKSRG